MSTPDPTGGEPDGAIFDIGYRTFTGTRLGRRPITGALYLDTLRGAFGLGRSLRAKVMPFALLAAAVVPTLVIVVIASVVGFSSLPVDYLTYLGGISTLVALFVAGQAPAAVSRDLRFRSITLYLARPLESADYVRAKYAALASAVLVFTAAPLLTLWLGSLLAELDAGEQTRSVLVALLAAALISVVVSGVALVVASLTPRRGLGVAAVIGVLVVSAGVQSALQELGEQNGQAALAGWSGLADPVTVVLGVLASLGADVEGAPVPPGALGGVVYVTVLLLLCLGSYALLLRRYARVSVS